MRRRRPGRLYFAILMKLRDPSHRVSVFERNRADDTFGWGVVFSDETLRNLKGGDPLTEQRISNSFVHWDDIDIHFKGRVITLRRPRLLRHRAQASAAHPAGPRDRPGRGADISSGMCRMSPNSPMPT